MTDTKPNQIEQLLVELMKRKEKLKDARAILKHYKIKSERLIELTKAKNEMIEQIKEEKDRIEDEYYKDKDFETARNDELTLKEEIKQRNAELRQVMATINIEQQLSTYDYNIQGERLKMQVERVVKVYVNGKEEK